MKIESGKLDRKIELMNVVVTTDEFKQRIKSFAVVATLYAQRLEMRTQDVARAGVRDAHAVARYLIRWRADISTAMRVVIDGKPFDIVGVDEPDRRTTLILTVEAAHNGD